MPVIARVAKRFYDALGEDVAIELMEWLNTSCLDRCRVNA